jgi:hypothetical protein
VTTEEHIISASSSISVCANNMCTSGYECSFSLVLYFTVRCPHTAATSKKMRGSPASGSFVEHLSMPVQCPPDIVMSSALCTSFAVVHKLHTEGSRCNRLFAPLFAPLFTPLFAPPVPVAGFAVVNDSSAEPEECAGMRWFGCAVPAVHAVVVAPDTLSTQPLTAVWPDRYGGDSPDRFFHASPVSSSTGSVGHASGDPSLRYSSWWYSSLLFLQGTNLSSRACMHEKRGYMGFKALHHTLDNAPLIRNTL